MPGSFTHFHILTSFLIGQAHRYMTYVKQIEIANDLHYDT